MKIRFNNLLLACLFITGIACKTAKTKNETNVVEEVKAAETVAKDPAPGTISDASQGIVQHEEVQAPDDEKQQNEVYTLSVSFFSIGEGTDGATTTVAFLREIDWACNVSVLQKRNISV